MELYLCYMRNLFTTIFFLISICCFSQTSPKPCSASEALQFDFWLGDWDATWGDTLHGTNHVEKILGSCAIQENFTDPRLNFIGKSWSVYNANTKQWQQTWVDNQGAYIALTGGMVGD